MQFEGNGVDIVLAAFANSAGAEATGNSNDVSRLTSRDNGLFAQRLHERIVSEGDPAAEAASNQKVDILAGVHSGVPSQVLDAPPAANVLAQAPAKASNMKEPAIIPSGSLPEESVQKAIPTSVAGGSTSQSAGIGNLSLAVAHGQPEAGKTKDVPVEASSGKSNEAAGEEVKEQQNSPPAVRVTSVPAGATEDAPLVDASQKHIAGQIKQEARASKKTPAETSDNEIKHLDTGKDAKSAEDKPVVASKSADMVVTQTMPLPGVLSVPAAVPTVVPVTVLPALSGEKQSAGGESTRGSSSKGSAQVQKNVALSVAAKSDAGSHPRTMAIAGSEPAGFSVHEDTPSTRVGSDSTKAAVSAVPDKDNSDRKLVNAGASATTSHAGAEVAGSSSGLAPGIVPAHSTAVNVLVKVQSADGGALMGSTHTSVPDHDVSGATVSPALDGGHRTLVATPTALEVGISNGSQGWLKIRAEMAGGGGVNASLSATVPSGQEMLHRELPSLTAYLQQERVAVNSVVIHAPASSGTGASSGSGMGSGNGGQPQQRGDGGSANRSPGTALSPNYVDDLGSSSVNTADANAALLVSPFAVGGSWLSVRA